MSAKLMGEVWELDLPQKHAWVLMSLCDHAEHDGTQVFPGNGYTAWKTGYSKATIKRVLRDLRDDYKLIELVEDGGGKRAAEWRICIENFNRCRKAPLQSRGAQAGNQNASLKENKPGSELRTGVSVTPGSEENKPGSHSRAHDDRNRPIETSDAKAGGSPPPPENPQGWHFEEYLRDELANADPELTRSKARRYTGQANKLLKAGVPPEEIYEACDRVVSEWERVRLDLDDARRDLLNGTQSNGRKPGKLSEGRRSAKGTPPEVIEYIFANTRNDTIKSRAADLRRVMELFDFSTGESPPYPIEKQLGGSDNERWAVLNGLQTLCRRAKAGAVQDVA